MSVASATNIITGIDLGNKKNGFAITWFKRTGDYKAPITLNAGLELVKIEKVND